MNKPAFSRMPIGLLLLASACAPSSSDPRSDSSDVNDAALGTFVRNKIIDDAAMLDSSALNAAQVDAFLARPYPDYDNQPSCLSGMTFDGKTAGTLIVETAHQYGLNPLFLLTHLQKESSLIGDTSPACAQATLARAFGCGCPDGGSCDPQYAGFVAQLDCAGSLTRGYLDDLDAGGATISGWSVGQATKTSDAYTVTPAGKAAAVLYTYTPWVGDKNAGGNSAPFGNYLFWKNWVRYANTLGYKSNSTAGASGGYCAGDADCNHLVSGLSVICSNSGAVAKTCIDGCHSDFDCPSSGSCDKSKTHWQCTNAPPILGTTCNSDSACDGPVSGSGRICGAASHVCAVGCHADSDCPDASHCDKSTSAWVCTTGGASPGKAPIGTACSDDSGCNGGLDGTGEICSASSHQCKIGCHHDSDCAAADHCDASGSTWVCAPAQSNTPIGQSIVGNYSPAAAVAYADAHWNDGKGECDEFVSDAAISAGHLGIPYSTWVPTTYGYLTSANVPFDEYTPTHTSVRACPGDIVIDSNDAGAGFCVEPGGNENCGHIGLVVQGGTSVDTILADFHNNAHHRLPIGNILGTAALGPYVTGYSTLRVYHLVNCASY